MIKVIDQHSLSEPGKRSNNEDNFGFVQGLVYVLCDGVGGADRGEVASDLVVKSFVESFSKDSNADIEQVFADTQQRMSNYLISHPEAEGMATTFTFSKIHENGIQIAWVGDSRVYQIRNGQTIFKTTDHSWVNEALKAGIITEEEAVDHPKSNVITRAVQGIHKKVSADIVWISDVKKDDVFFHCSDGVLEAWDDQDLCALFSSGYSSGKIVERIKEECRITSKDNFTALFYTIDNVNLKKQDIGGFIDNHVTKKKASPNYSIWKLLFFISLLVIVVLIGFILFGNSLKKVDHAPKKSNIEKNESIRKKKVETQIESATRNATNNGEKKDALIKTDQNKNVNEKADESPN